jgi:hypothetical protein
MSRTRLWRQLTLSESRCHKRQSLSCLEFVAAPFARTLLGMCGQPSWNWRNHNTSMT